MWLRKLLLWGDLRILHLTAQLSVCGVGPPQAWEDLARCPVLRKLGHVTSAAGEGSSSQCGVRRMQVHCLTGHDDTVCSILTQSTDPQARCQCDGGPHGKRA